LKTDKTTTPEPLTFIDALDQTQIRYRAHPHFKKLEGTPWENDAAVIAADMMVNAVKDHLSRIQELEDHVKALREAGGEAMDLISSAQSVLERYLQPDGHTKERCMDLLIGLFDGPRQRKVESAWDAASKPSNNNTGS